MTPKLICRSLRWCWRASRWKAALAAHNIDKPVFDANVRGTVDLTKITRIFPLEGMTVDGPREPATLPPRAT